MKNECIKRNGIVDLSEWVSGWVGGWVDGWVGGGLTPCRQLGPSSRREHVNALRKINHKLFKGLKTTANDYFLKFVRFTV